ncbi:hypothetical protein KO516_00380 [Citreicella sp. C3M06]|uniref:hypothetical protein n=1 Tax=Citreicella sp. C3M06 TaxID=2841564 RepID=UPI001C0843B4|nr:hypothetical protein [Citreicella sp. C3M06]MBU2959296.1 hypothetical protein [Citreicella sp. C3M06]
MATDTPTPSRTAEIRAVARKDIPRAQTMLEEFISGLFDIPVSDLRINQDQYSLNSLNGFFESGDQAFFFKFHQEDGEEDMTGEYYRADILSSAGLPVDQPVHMSTLAGEQVLIYRRRSDPRFSDVLFELDQAPDARATARARAAEADLNAHILSVAKETLQAISPAQAAAEPIHRLFYERLIDLPAGSYPGGRLAKFYVGKRFAFPGGVSLDWDEIADATVRVNGIRYGSSLRQAFDDALTRYAPLNTASAGGIVAHGDAHNANVWYERGEDQDRLSFFDPAFAGNKVPGLLAEVKSTFHNIFAHPFWLYNPEMAAERFEARVTLSEGVLSFETDWHPTPARLALLESKAETFWKPWLAHLKAQGLLPEDWEEIVRSGLFLSPTLVMNLNAGEGAERHNPTSSAIGLGIALAAASRPVDGEDMFSRFFDSVRPE